MRVKQLWLCFPATANLVWHRITFSRLTIAYFVFTFVHFVIQLAFQIKAFTINSNAAHFVNNILIQGHATNGGLPFLSGDTLSMCSWVPSNLDNTACPVVWSGAKGKSAESVATNISYNSDAWLSVPAPTSSPSDTISSTPITINSTPSQITVPSSSSPSSIYIATVASTARTSSNIVHTVTVFVTPAQASGISRHSRDTNDGNSVFEKREMPTILAFQEDGQTKINITGISVHNKVATLNQSCLWSLNWPASRLSNNRREDVVFIGFQFWVLGMSFVALLNESIPHILASLLTHMLATSWGAFQITSTEDFRSTFNRVITNGACNGVSLLPHYWQNRASAEIISLAFNILAMFISCLLTWQLIKVFGWQTFKRVGASLTINRLYKIVLVLSVLIQLGLFFTIVTVSLWIDQLMNSPIGDLASFQVLYKTTSIITLILSIPWLIIGWFAIRRELRLPMLFFLFLSVLYLTGWSIMFISTTFRWTFVTWRFFSVMAVASVILMVVSFVLGVICRYNFGKGLSRHFNGQQNLPGDDYFVNHSGSDVEKVEFPSTRQPSPTYSTEFESKTRVPALGQTFMITRGPRFFHKFAQPLETSIVSPPHPVYRIVGKVSDVSTYNRGITRSDTLLSSRSGLASFSSHSDRGVRFDSQSKQRWVIE